MQSIGNKKLNKMNEGKYEMKSFEKSALRQNEEKAIKSVVNARAE